MRSTSQEGCALQRAPVEVLPAAVLLHDGAHLHMKAPTTPFRILLMRARWKKPQGSALAHARRTKAQHKKGSMAEHGCMAGQLARSPTCSPDSVLSGPLVSASISAS